MRQHFQMRVVPSLPTPPPPTPPPPSPLHPPPPPLPRFQTFLEKCKKMKGGKGYRSGGGGGGGLFINLICYLIRSIFKCEAPFLKIETLIQTLVWSNETRHSYLQIFVYSYSLYNF